MHELAFPLLVGLILVALAFDYLNGLHDAANSIATVVATRLLSPVRAVIFAAFFNFAAYFLTIAFPSLHAVAETIGKGLIDQRVVTPAVIFGALGGAMFWNIVTWLRGIPSSSSHALVGGMIGAGVAHAGITGVQWTGLNKTLLAIVLSPTIGMMLAMTVMLASSWIFRRSSSAQAERSFRVLHLCSSAAYSLSHGLNDAQKTMGIITVLLYSTGNLTGPFEVPHWVAISCYVAIALGTMTGGWKIIETMGSRITKLSQHQGFSASMAGSIVLFGASAMGIPVSTTHTITGAIIGAGTARRASAVRWGVAKSVVAAWIITIPASALVGAGFYALTLLF
ncbi:inorganic phosphate transporter [Microvirga sp. SRT01]|jgi:PiT family inorganic phosphate transporter|uniref:Inorganic phosphate transporter n=1 Tax=Sphingomonas longa TaxID=2778730 RepID=A0ABS2D8D9_9SPHN|nr:MULTISPECIES: inorganic phosphate transporter [Alphaproteobacteria]MBM6577194.1 inorganic phosphate transporter [Sphingomonas sp. BT552]MBR7710238.1 inorganic phosphate transporter [Microvirga sp. SRT01]